MFVVVAFITIFCLKKRAANSEVHARWKERESGAEFEPKWVEDEETKKIGSKRALKRCALISRVPKPRWEIKLIKNKLHGLLMAHWLPTRVLNAFARVR